MGIIRVQNIGPVAGGVHPAVDHRLGRGIALGNVFTGTAVGNAEILDHLERCAVDGAGVGEILVVLHVLRLVAGYAAQLPVVGQGLQAVLCPDLIDEPDDFLLVAGNAGIQGGDVDGLAGVDQVKILDLRVGAFEFADADFVFDCQLPQGVAGDDGVCVAADALIRSTGMSAAVVRIIENSFRMLLPP